MKALEKVARRAKRIRSSLAKNITIPRLSVFRSNKYIWAQIIDDKHGKTLVAQSTKALKEKGTKVEQAKKLGAAIAKLAVDKKIKNIRFDRGAYRYHGRVKAVADGAREGGLNF